MLKALALTLMTLFGLVFGLFVIVLLPLLLIGAVLKLLLFLLLLPFRLLGFVVGTVGALLLGLVKVLCVVGLGLVGLALVTGAAVALPLAPLALIVVGVWMVARLLRSARTAGSPA